MIDVRFSLKDYSDSEEFKRSKKTLVLEILACQRSGYTCEAEARRKLKELNWKSGMPHGAFIDDRGDPLVENEKDLMKHSKEGLIHSIRYMKEQGVGIRKIAEDLSVGVGTVYRVFEAA